MTSGQVLAEVGLIAQLPPGLDRAARGPAMSFPGGSSLLLRVYKTAGIRRPEDREQPMTGREPVETTNLDRYDNPALAWARADQALGAEMPRPAVPSFLGTVRPDGRPSAAGVGAVWRDGELYFTSSPKARKARNLAANPACTFSVRLQGIDVVIEGEAARVTDAETLKSIAAVYHGAGWPAEVEGDAFTAPFNAPSAGPPPWHLYRMRVSTVFGVATAEPYGATRWRFEDWVRGLGAGSTGGARDAGTRWA
jgi:hypothetical protein